MQLLCKCQIAAPSSGLLLSIYIVYLPDAPRMIRNAFGDGDESEAGSRNNTLHYLSPCLFGLTFFSLLINSNSSIFMAIFSDFHNIYNSLSYSFICHIYIIFLSFNQHENQHCKKYLNTPNWELPRGDYVVVFSSSLIKKQKIQVQNEGSGGDTLIRILFMLIITNGGRTQKAHYNCTKIYCIYIYSRTWCTEYKGALQ